MVIKRIQSMHGKKILKNVCNNIISVTNMTVCHSVERPGVERALAILHALYFIRRKKDKIVKVHEF